MKIKMIAAASYNSVIGQNHALPWNNNFPEDLAFFRKMTLGSTIIMGRKTFESVGRAMPKRRNIVLTNKVVPKTDYPGIEIYHSIDSALNSCKEDDTVWIIGGSYVYQAALPYAEEIYITTIPKVIYGEGLVYFPYVNPDFFKLKERIELNKEKNLYCNVYQR